jgi:uncharacterized membrane protein
MISFLTDAYIGHNELPIPAIAFGVIALVGFIALGLITWSYRDVANRHSHKTADQQAHH